MRHSKQSGSKTPRSELEFPFGELYVVRLEGHENREAQCHLSQFHAQFKELNVQHAFQQTYTWGPLGLKLRPDRMNLP